MQRWRSAALLGAWVASACSGDKSTAPRPACTGAVTVVATREARPLVTWTPNCTVAALQVDGPPSLQGVADVRWAVRGGTAGIASGVRLGVVPPGAAQETAPRDLSGSGLIVRVFGADGAFLGSVQTDVP